MGILTRQQGELFVISSDRIPGAAQKARLSPRPTAAYQVWTGTSWSPHASEAMLFESLDAADDYVRENLVKIID